MPQHSSDFSFDLYPGLDRELNDIYRRNLEQGVASSEQVGNTALATTVNDALTKEAPEAQLSTDAYMWAFEEIDHSLDKGVLSSWRRYEDQLGMTVPTSYTDLLQAPHAKETIEHLYEAKQALEASGEVTPEGLNIGETMHLVLMPWQAIRDHVDTFSSWVKDLRTTQGITVDDYFNDDLLRKVEQETGGIYRDPEHPDQYMSAKRYLDLKIEKDGPWGLMLMQTSDDAGIDRLVQGSAADRSPNALTNNGNDHFTLAGQNVDGLGIFEWIALTFQKDPKTLSTRDVSWLLANRLDVNGDPYVPYGYWDGGQVRSYLCRAGYGDDDTRPRLAVM